MYSSEEKVITSCFQIDNVNDKVDYMIELGDEYLPLKSFLFTNNYK